MLKITKFEDLTYNDKYLLMSTLIFKNQSIAEKRKVGATLGNPETMSILMWGHNKMFKDMYDEKCEDHNGETIPYVIHAEESVIMDYLKQENFASTEISMSDLTMYVSYSPCINCCKMIAHLGIKRIMFIEKHDVNFDNCEWAPAEFLHKMGIEIIHAIECPTLNENPDFSDVDQYLFKGKKRFTKTVLYDGKN